MGEPSSSPLSQKWKFKIIPSNEFSDNFPIQSSHRVRRKKIQPKIENPLKIVYVEKTPETFKISETHAFPSFSEFFGGSFIRSLKVSIGGREVFPRHYPYVEMMQKEEKVKEEVKEKEKEEAKIIMKPQKAMKILPVKPKEKFLPKQKFSKPPKNFRLQQPGYK